MKITRNDLRQIIKEEISSILEQDAKVEFLEDEMEIGPSVEKAVEEVIDQNQKMGTEQGQGAAMLQAVLTQHGADAAAKELSHLMQNYNLEITDTQKVALDL